jgi:hypothetical protein
MAGLVLPIYRLERNNCHNNGVPAKEYLIRYNCGDCRNVHSVRVKAKIYENEVNLSKGKVKVRLSLETTFPKKATMLFGAMKMLDALGIKYVPDSVRLVKA